MIDTTIFCRSEAGGVLEYAQEQVRSQSIIIDQIFIVSIHVLAPLPLLIPSLITSMFNLLFLMSLLRRNGSGSPS